jgi:uridylate kinase
MKPLVISMGGSILSNAETEFVKDLSAIIIRESSRRPVFVVAGGGSVARDYIKKARSLGSDESFLDEIGIMATKLNAALLISALRPHCAPLVPKSFEEAMILSESYPIVVMGGTHPGHTTDAVAAMLAERAGADNLIDATSVNGVYNADPKKDSSAKRIERMTHRELLELVIKSGISGAGSNIVIDPMAAKIAERSGITLYVLNGRDLDALERAIKGRRFDGTIVEG